MLDLNSKASSYTDVIELLNSDNASSIYDDESYDSSKCDKPEPHGSCSSPVIRHGMKPLVKYFNNSLHMDLKSTASKREVSEKIPLTFQDKSKYIQPDTISECFSASTFSIYNSLIPSSEECRGFTEEEPSHNWLEIESKILSYLADNKIEAIDLKDELRLQSMSRPRAQNTTISLVQTMNRKSSLLLERRKASMMIKTNSMNESD